MSPPESTRSVTGIRRRRRGDGERRGQANIEVGLFVIPPDVDRVPMASGREHSRQCAVHLEHDVGDDGGPVDDEIGPLEEAPDVEAGFAANPAMPVMTPTDWSLGVVGTFSRKAAPSLSIATRSVNVPPTSMPTPKRIALISFAMPVR